MKTSAFALIITILISGCSTNETPSSPDSPTATILESSWLTFLNSTDGFSPGSWNWTYTCNDSLFGEAKLDLVSLTTGPAGWKIRWTFEHGLPDTAQIVLSPEGKSPWHDFHWTRGDSLPPIPLPRQNTDSDFYPDLLDFIKELTEPYFEMVVTHWPNFPIPIRLVQANNGPIDLAACLSEAADQWNEGALHPWFVIDPDASWGVRLVHFPDREMHPPLAAQITRLDSEGRPLRVHLLAGNNYNSELARPYVVRGFVHELGHALFLWGHSMDRIHCLWGLAPPLVSEPSSDERKAARMWHGLPDGLDLSRYGLESMNLQ